MLILTCVVTPCNRVGDLPSIGTEDHSRFPCVRVLNLPSLPFARSFFTWRNRISEVEEASISNDESVFFIITVQSLKPAPVGNEFYNSESIRHLLNPFGRQVIARPVLQFDSFNKNVTTQRVHLACPKFVFWPGVSEPIQLCGCAKGVLRELRHFTQNKRRALSEYGRTEKTLALFGNRTPVFSVYPGIFICCRCVRI